MNNVVIVLFNDAINLFRLQFQTIERFLEPCTINIVLNEEKSKKLKKHIECITKDSKHKIVYFNKANVLKSNTFVGHGYLSQQLCKLLVPIDGEYVVLDDKDLFVKPTTYKQLVACSYPVMDNHINEGFDMFYDICVKKFGYTVQPHQPYTPRLINKQVVNKIIEAFKTEKKLITWFIRTQCHPIVVSEFMLYDFFDSNPKSVKENYSWYPNITKMSNGIVLRSAIHIAKIHRDMYNETQTQVIVDDYFKKIIFCRYS